MTITIAQDIRAIFLIPLPFTNFDISLMARKGNIKFIIDIFASKISLLLLGSLTIWLGYSVVKEAYRKHQVRAEIESLKQEIMELEKKNSSLSSFVDSFQDPENIELEAKKRLNLKKPGEEVAVILRGKDSEEQNIVQGIDLSQKEGELVPLRGITRGGINPLKWWQYITGSK